MRIELEVGEDGKVELKNLTYAELLAWCTAHGILLHVETSGKPGCGGFKVGAMTGFRVGAMPADVSRELADRIQKSLSNLTKSTDRALWRAAGGDDFPNADPRLQSDPDSPILVEGSDAPAS